MGCAIGSAAAYQHAQIVIERNEPLAAHTAHPTGHTHHFFHLAKAVERNDTGGAGKCSNCAPGKVAGRRSGRGKAETREHRGGDISSNACMQLGYFDSRLFSEDRTLLCGFLNRADANSSTGSAGNSRSGPLEFPCPSIMIGRMTGRGGMRTGRHGGRGTPSNRASGEAGSRPATIRHTLSDYDWYTQPRSLQTAANRWWHSHMSLVP